MTKEDFIKKATAYGMKDEEIYSAYKKLEQDGAFDDATKAEPTTEDTTAKLPSVDGLPKPAYLDVPKEKGFLEGITDAVRTGAANTAPKVTELGKTFLEGASALGRGVAALPTALPGGESFMDAWGREKSNLKGVPGLLENILRDEATPFSLMGGGAAAPLAKTIGGAVAKPLLGKMASGATVGLAEGLTSGAVHGVESVLEGEKTVGEAAKSGLVEGAFSAGMGGFMPGLSGTIQKGLAASDKLMGMTAERLSGVAEEALRKYGTKEGAAQMRNAATLKNQVINDLFKLFDDPDKFIEEKAIVDAALERMPPVNISKTVEALQKAKPLGKIGAMKDVPAEIEGYINDLVAAADPEGNIDAVTFRELRKEFDALIGKGFDKDKNEAAVRALKAARETMKQDLIETAKTSGNSDYADAMATWAEKIDLIERLRGYNLGSEQARNKGMERFSESFFGKNSTDKRELIEGIEKAFGKEFLDKAKIVQLSSALAPDGSMPLFPVGNTGKVLLGGQLGSGATALAAGHPLGALAALPIIGLTSPRTAVPMLNVSDKAARYLPKVVDAAAPSARAALRGLVDEEINKTDIKRKR